MPRPRAPKFAAMYRQVGAETAVAGASPHRLVGLLFDAYMDALAQARGAMRSGQTEAKGRAVVRAVRIVDEGLRAALNLKDGGPLAADLHALYGYLTVQLTRANLHNDEVALDQCVQLMQPLRDAWAAIGPMVEPGAH
ncbi:MAG: flagellar export chaperone FliS [Aquabacterium sp.]